MAAGMAMFGLIASILFPIALITAMFIAAKKKKA